MLYNTNRRLSTSHIYIRQAPHLTVNLLWLVPSLNATGVPIYLATHMEGCLICSRDSLYNFLYRHLLHSAQNSQVLLLEPTCSFLFNTKFEFCKRATLTSLQNIPGCSSPAANSETSNRRLYATVTRQYYALEILVWCPRSSRLCAIFHTSTFHIEYAHENVRQRV
jgi:hypothetical protein